MCIEQHPEGVLLLLALDKVCPEGGHLSTGFAADLVVQNIDDGQIYGDIYLSFSR